jgi:hypothetical protein
MNYTATTVEQRKGALNSPPTVSVALHSGYRILSAMIECSHRKLSACSAIIEDTG